MKRGGRIARKKPIKRGKRIRRVNPERAAKRRERDFGGTYRDYIVSLPCDACGRPGPGDPSHIKSRGAQGRAHHMLPHCRPCHDEYGAGRETFAAKHGTTIDALIAKAAELHRVWQANELRESA